MKIGITGITCGLGLRLSELLVKKNYKISGLIRETSNTNDISDKIELFYGDIAQYETLKKFITGLDVCIHLAAQVAHAVRKRYFDVNVKGTDNICRAILNFNPGCRLIHCSTISALKVNPLFKFLNSNYGVSKYYGEKKVLDYTKDKGLKATIIYPGLIYGPYDKTVTLQTIQLLKYGKIRLIKGGENNAPLIFIDELCDLFIRTIQNINTINKKYISVKGLDAGVHDFFKMIADKTGYNTIPKRIYPKILYYILAVVIEGYYKLFKKGKNPPFNKRLVNIFSINFSSYKKKYDDPYKDLGWGQNTSKEFLTKKIEDTVKWYNKKGINQMN